MQEKINSDSFKSKYRIFSVDNAHRKLFGIPYDV
jgi:hypothetical protein